MNIERLRNWFLQHKRAFSWRENPSPYSVWISEVMLQQTQSSRVTIYFDRWMKMFPTISHLAEAPLEKVLKCWEGLGYYSRAKSLHAAAQDIVSRFGGKIPDTKDALSSIKGLGPYTTGAILSFGFHQKEAACDANVMRVLSRHFAVHDDVCKQNTQKNIYNIASSLLPEKAPWEITEALIELGALVCQKKPQCARCPLKDSCAGLRLGIQETLPLKSARMKYETLFREVAVIMSDENSFLVGVGKKGMPCAGLYEFPYFNVSEAGLSPDAVENEIAREFQIQTAFHSYLPEEKHSFTRFRVQLYPKLFYAKVSPVKGYRWCTPSVLETLTFSSGHKRVLLNLLH